MRRKIAVLCIVLMFISLFSGCLGDDQTPTTQPTTVTPTTVTPTTVAPTTAAPTTAVPTTAAPTTAAPTVEPTTAAPTTVKPTTKKPTTKKPTTAKVTTAKPTTATPTTVPAKPVITLERQQYWPGEAVVFRFSGGEGGTMSLCYPNGHTEYFKNVGASISMSFYIPGLYVAQLTNNKMASATVTFSVLEPPTTAAPTTAAPTTAVVAPSFARVEINKNSFAPGEIVNFILSSDGTWVNYKLFVFMPNGSMRTFENLMDTYALTVTESGSYSAVLQAVNSKGSVQSNAVTFTVTAPVEAPTTAPTVAPTTAKPTTLPTKPLGQSTLEDEKGRTLRILIPGLNYNDSRQWQNKVIAAFQAQYPDVMVEFISATWSDWEVKMLAAYQSGDPIDLIYHNVNTSAVYFNKGLIQPIAPYVNMNNPYLHKDTMDVCFKYAGNYYAATAETNFGIIYYNKDIFAANGVEDPLALYLKGEWTWAKFVRYAKTLTNRDQRIYGYASESPYLFHGSNASSALKLDANGRFALNIDDPSFVASLELIQDGWYTSKWQGWEGSAMSFFQSGRAAMVGSWTLYESSVNSWAAIYGTPPLNYGAVPMPKGPNNPEGKNMVHSTGWSIGMGADCPAHAGKLIDMLVTGQYEYQGGDYPDAPAAHAALYQQMRSKMFCVIVNDSAIGGGYDMISEIASGTSVAQAIEKYKPEYQRKIDEINRKV